MEHKPVCISSKRRITNDTGAVQFPCPSCGKETIVRSKQAREIVAPYTCPSCGFTGPN
ncbi:TPA: RNA-binding protein [Candidatus Woesearchaeota archaeon]|nr:RNA-binding protein [Candidatus Woesearchaeota archaeon]HII68663.1 RNA-binding protein [Candidatus Woesearchaeota archaeon]